MSNAPSNESMLAVLSGHGMTDSRYVGRAGGLAVALGIGTAVMLSAAPVWADSTGLPGSSAGGGSADSQHSTEPAERGATTASPDTSRSAPRKRTSTAARSSAGAPGTDAPPVSPRVASSLTAVVGRAVGGAGQHGVVTEVAVPLGDGDRTAMSEVAERSPAPQPAGFTETAVPPSVPVVSAAASPVSGVLSAAPDGLPGRSLIAAAASSQPGSPRAANGLTARTPGAAAVSAAQPRPQWMKPKRVERVLRRFQATGVDPRILLSANYTVAELKRAKFTASELKKAGVALAELVAAKYTPNELKDAKFTAAELTDSGITLTDLITAKYTPTQLKDAKFTAAELKNAGITLTDLITAKYTPTQLKDAKFTAANLKDVGFALSELQTAGFSNDELASAGFDIPSKSLAYLRGFLPKGGDLLVGTPGEYSLAQAQAWCVGNADCAGFSYIGGPDEIPNNTSIYFKKSDAGFFPTPPPKGIWTTYFAVKPRSFDVRTVQNSSLSADAVNAVYASGSTVYAATNKGLSVSTDGGTTFATRTSEDGLAASKITGLFVSGATIYAATSDGLSISVNGGASFSKVNGLSATGGVYANGNTVCAWTSSGLITSSDGGKTFTTRTKDNGLGSIYGEAVFVSDGTIYAATSNAGLSISTDDGASFTTRTTEDGLGSNETYGVVLVDHVLYVATWKGLSISTDGGKTFTTRTKDNGLASDALRRVAVSGTTVYAGTWGNGVSISTDGGKTFVNNLSYTKDGMASDYVYGLYVDGTTVYTSAGFGGGGLSIGPTPAVR